MKCLVVYMTAADRKEAWKLGRMLVEERLAACVNLLGSIRSIYHWKGRLEEGREVALLAKTTAACFPALVRRVKAMHSYETPCIVAWSLAGGHRPFMEWVAAETRPAGEAGPARSRRATARTGGRARKPAR